MSRRLLIVPVLIALTAAVSAQSAPPAVATTTLDDQAELALTVYNSDLALVRDVRNVQIGRGVSDRFRFGRPWGMRRRPGHKSPAQPFHS